MIDAILSFSIRQRWLVMIGVCVGFSTAGGTVHTYIGSNTSAARCKLSTWSGVLGLRRYKVVTTDLSLCPGVDRIEVNYCFDEQRTDKLYKSS